MDPEAPTRTVPASRCPDSWLVSTVNAMDKSANSKMDGARNSFVLKKDRLKSSKPLVAQPFIESSKAKRQATYNQIVSSFIAMLQGVEVLCGLAIVFLYKDNFGLDPASMNVVLSVVKLPWAVKPVWAILSDTCPFFGYRRKGYIILGAALCCVATTMMGFVGYLNAHLATASLFLYFLGSAMCNVIGEALVVEAGRDQGLLGAAKTISTFFAMRKLSFAAMSYLSGFLLVYMRKEHLFLIATAMPVAVLASATLMEEEPAASSGEDGSVPTSQLIKRQVARLKEVVSEPVLHNSAVFIFVLMATPSSGQAFFYFLTNKLHFSVELLGRMALVQSLSSLAGILIYMTFFKETSIRSLFFWSTMIVVPFCLLPIVAVKGWNQLIGIPSSAFILADNALMEFLGEFEVLPILVLAAQLCPVGLESTIYSYFLSVFNLGLALGAVISAGITSLLGVTSQVFDNLPLLIGVCALTTYLPLLAIRLCPTKAEVDARLRRPSDATIQNEIWDSPASESRSLLRYEASTTADDLSGGDSPSDSAATEV